MKTFITLKKISLSLFIIIIFGFKLQAQSKLVPSHVNWKADDISVSLKSATEVGVSIPTKLSIELSFDRAILKDIPKEQITFEFKWFYYYVTNKAFMDSYKITYDKATIEAENQFKFISSRKNINSGWWEVQVIASIDGKEVTFDKISKFQIYIK